jgi:hypothetical protein
MSIQGFARFLLGFALGGCGRVAGSAPDVELARAPATPAVSKDPLEAAVGGSRAIHGRLETREGQTILRVWGTPREMGFAHGYLLRDRIRTVVDGYALGVIPASSLTAVADLYAAVAAIPPALREEAEAVVEGMTAAGGSDIDGLGRPLRGEDLLLLNAMTDLLAVGCSSVSAWGPVTEHDSTLAGAPAVVRNLDWSDDADLLANQVVIVYAPSDPAHQPVVSVAFAGYLGCLSCMNEGGVTVLFNMGYGDGASGWSGAIGFAPANLMLRDALQRRDPDGDGETTADDLEHVVRQSQHVGSYVLHVLEPSATATRHGRAPARVLEIESDGIATRFPDDASRLGPRMLAATNHLRKKAAPRACTRYRRIETQARERDRRFDRTTLWELGRGVRLPEVVHTLLVEPDTRTLGVWLRRPDESATSRADPVEHRWESLVDEVVAR